jgi:hypothetical protein
MRNLNFLTYEENLIFFFISEPCWIEPEVIRPQHDPGVALLWRSHSCLSLTNYGYTSSGNDVSMPKYSCRCWTIWEIFVTKIDKDTGSNDYILIETESNWMIYWGPGFPPPPITLTSCLSISVLLWVVGRAYWREWGGGGQNIRRRESLVVSISHNTLWLGHSHHVGGAPMVLLTMK